MNLLSYVLYIFQLFFRFSGPCSVGATMEMEGWDEDEIQDTMYSVAYHQACSRWAALCAPPAWHANDTLGPALIVVGKGNTLPTLADLQHAKDFILPRHNPSRWVNWAMEGLVEDIRAYSLRGEPISGHS